MGRFESLKQAIWSHPGVIKANFRLQTGVVHQPADEIASPRTIIGVSRSPGIARAKREVTST
jgi:hypothetical protein